MLWWQMPMGKEKMTARPTFPKQDQTFSDLAAYGSRA
jgi:hypothetical protein